GSLGGDPMAPGDADRRLALSGLLAVRELRRVQRDRQRRAGVRRPDEYAVGRAVADHEVRLRIRQGRLAAVRVAADVDRVALVLVEVEPTEERGVERRGGELRDATADGLDEHAALDGVVDDEALLRRALADEVVDREAP